MRKRTPAREKIILGSLRKGTTRLYACTRAKVSARANRTWMEDDPKWREQVEAAEEHHINSELADIRKAGEKDWHAKAWGLERRWPGRFGRKDKVTHDGELKVSEKQKKAAEVNKLPADLRAAIAEAVCLLNTAVSTGP